MVAIATSEHPTEAGDPDPEISRRASSGDSGDLTAGVDHTASSARWLHPSIDGLVLSLFLLVGVRLGLAPLKDNSFLTHLATGRLIFERGAIPSSDPYSFTAFGDPWTVQSRGASVLYAGAERTVGLVGIRLLNAALILVLVALLWQLTRPAGRVVGRALTLGLVVCMGTGLWVERPLLFGAVFLALVLLAAEDRLDPRWLVPVMWLWANTHGSFPFGIVFLVLVAAGRWLDERQRPAVELRALAWASVGTVLAAVGPVGPKLLTFPFQLLSRRDAFEGVAEWEPPSWDRGVEKFFAAQMVLLLVVTLARHRRWRVLLPALVFGLAAGLSSRNILQASIVATPLLAAGLHGLGSLDGTKRPRLARPLAGALGCLALLLVVSGIAAPDTALDPYPERATTWMRSHDLLDLNDRVVTRDFVGNYIEFQYGPERVRSYIDDRVDMYPIEVIADYTQLLRPGGDYEAVLDRAEATAVLWDKDSDFGRWLEDSEHWRVVFEDETWVVALPVDGPSEVRRP